MLTLFRLKTERIKQVTIGMVPLVFSVAAYGSTSFDESVALKYLSAIKVFQPPISEVIRIGGMNNNFHFSTADKQYILCHVPNDLIDFRTYISNYSIVAPFMQLPKLVYVDQSRKIFIREYIEGKVLQLDADHQTIVKIARTMHALHNSSLTFTNNSNAKELIAKMKFTQLNNGITTKPNEIDAIVQRVYSVMESLKIQQKPCHNDLNASNFIISSDTLCLIDWEFSAMNDLAWDLAYFITISRLPPESVAVFLTTYLSLDNTDPTLLDRVAAYQPVTLIFIAAFFDYKSEKHKEESQFLFAQAKELYNSSRVQDALKRLEDIRKSPRLVCL